VEIFEELHEVGRRELCGGLFDFHQGAHETSKDAVSAGWMARAGTGKDEGGKLAIAGSAEGRTEK
jgi:hypothetical protein